MTLRTLRRRLATAAAFTMVAAAVGGLAAPASASQAKPEAPAGTSAPQPPLTTSRTIAKFDWKNATLDTPWSNARLRDGLRCPSGRVTFRDVAPGESDYGQVQRGRATLLVRKVDTADVNRDGQPDVLVHFLCQRTNKDVGYSWYYVYSFTKVRGGYHGKVTGYRPQVLDYVTSSDFASNGRWSIQTIDARYGGVDVRQWVRAKRSITVDRTFRWNNRHGLIPNRPLPIHPEADRAPR
ncbi:hypothetical protein [Cryptosporangium sp. NPDC048952]|uniref:hypothetical protein n=1 Tax=Cryptosporangium sp. NPDC048952 TaxID=3363961 RepID=UPI00371F2865